MKPSKKVIGTIGGLLLMFIVAAIFTTTSCEKENVAPIGSTVGNNTSDLSREARTDAVKPKDMAPILTIRHESARTAVNDYVFMVYPNNVATFVGVRNVAFVGERSFDIPKNTFTEFQTLMDNSNFFGIVDEHVYTPDLPLIEVTYSVLQSANDASGLARTKTLVEFMDGTPAELSNLRTTIEKLFKISDLVGTDPGPKTVSSTQPSK